MSLAGFEPVIPATEQPHVHGLDRNKNEGLRLVILSNHL
jgi:hypothetical protein